jgi:hypothetical protein
MTNAIGVGTVNTTVNMDREESRIWGRLALDEDKSKGQKLRELALEGLRARRADLAHQVDNIRKHHRALAAGLHALIGIGLTVASLSTGDDLRRAPRGRKVAASKVEVRHV